MHFFRPNRRQWLALAAAAPALVLAEQVRPGLDPAGWLVSEKLDGVRALWDGERLRFRSGGLIAAPAAFLARLPRTPLDGELWLGRGRFEALSATVRRAQPRDDEWQGVRYAPFELPQAPGRFAERAQRLQQLLREVAGPSLWALPQERLDSPEALRQHAQAVYQQAVVTRAMPLNNATAITDAERALIRRWFEMGAPVP